MEKGKRSTFTLEKFMKIICILLIICIIVMTIIAFVKPLFFNDKTKSIGKTYENYVSSYAIVNKYVQYFINKDYKRINNMIPIVKQRNKTVYDQYSQYLSDHYDSIDIKWIEKINDSDFRITFSIGSNVENAIIVHFHNNGQTFKIFYDNKLQSY